MRDFPLNARVAIVPFTANDELTLEVPVYGVNEAYGVRKTERVKRFSERRSVGDDLHVTDWEQAVANNERKVGKMVLPGISFMAVDRINESGMLKRGHRPVLGRHARRNSVRPNIIVPTVSNDMRQFHQWCSDMDLLVLNVQGLRGRRAIENVRLFLQRRGQLSATLVVAATPTDLQLLGIEVENGNCHFIGTPPSLENVKLIPVGKDRLAAEREFEFAIEGLSNSSAACAKVVELGKAAWWACRNSLQSNAEVREVLRFMEAANALTLDSPGEGAMLTSLKNAVQKQQQQEELRRERYRAVIEAVNTTSGPGDTVLIVRDEFTARQMRTALSALLGVSEDDLSNLGVHVKGPRPVWDLGPVGTCIVAGFFGTGTVDAVLGTRPSKLTLIFDPIEARVAWFGVCRQIEWLTKAGREDATSALAVIAAELGRNTVGFSDAVDLSLSFSIGNETAIGHASRHVPAADEVAVYFTDGTRLEVGLHSRFEIFGEGGRRLRSVPAIELQPGDQVVVLEEGSRALFSDKILAALDQGPLAEQAEQRATWLSLVRTVISTKKPMVRDLAQRMADKGQQVDMSTIRTWLKPSTTGLSTVPDSRDRFMAFAAALGLALDEGTLSEFYGSIERWRIAHRSMGRDLARAIRAAYLGRLGAESLAKIERLWGLNARHLVEAARVAIVDEIVLPEGYANAID